MNNRKFYARIRNQFTRPLGDGFGGTEREALEAAHKAADRELASANPNWKWRKAKIKVELNPFARPL